MARNLRKLRCWLFGHQWSFEYNEHAYLVTYCSQCEYELGFFAGSDESDG